MAQEQALIATVCRDRLSKGIAAPYLKQIEWLAETAHASEAATAKTTLFFYNEHDELDGEYVVELVLCIRQSSMVEQK